MEAARPVLLDDEQVAGPTAAVAAERLRCAARIAFPAVLLERANHLFYLTKCFRARAVGDTLRSVTLL